MNGPERQHLVVVATRMATWETTTTTTWPAVKPLQPSGLECRVMNILLATSEAIPFAKTGGLADVLGALPRELARLGHYPVVIMPAYRHAKRCGQLIQSTGINFS